MSDLADLVRAGDPDRYAATRAAPDAARAKLWPLYAFNLEIARAPYVTQEPMIAQMRLQFWTDVLRDIESGAPARAHQVAEPLAALWRDEGLPVELGEAMIAARHWDIARAPFADEAAFAAHLDATAGHLMWLAARVLGAPVAAEGVVRDMGYASGLANWLVAVPALRAAGRVPLLRDDDAAIRALAEDGLDRLRRARAARAQVPDAATPALLCGWQAGAILRHARSDPGRVAEGTLRGSEFARRGSLLMRGVSGRW
ncbi:MAG: squalene/phytoene synthase family protein [Rhodobacteraceae bacterium]|nr:squalene/phytoene synthase family protein [Paracoccaceae bacterium]